MEVLWAVRHDTGKGGLGASVEISSLRRLQRSGARYSGRLGVTCVVTHSYLSLLLPHQTLTSDSH